MPATTPTRLPPTQAAVRGARSLAGQSLRPSALLVPQGRLVILDLPDPLERQVLPAPQGQPVPQEQPVQQEQLGLLDQPEQPAPPDQRVQPEQLAPRVIRELPVPPDRPALRELLAQPAQPDRQGPPVPRV